jgi:DNA-binding NarL/FixJ family response regulator
MHIRVVLVDDYRILREGLIALLRSEKDIRVVGDASDGLAGVALVRELRPDVVVMDLSLPGLNGIEAMLRIHAFDADVKVVCRSLHDERRQVLAAVKAGAVGYVGRDGSCAELVHAIRAVRANQTYLPPALVGLLVDSYRDGTAVQRASCVRLTPRERELVQLLSEGYSTQQIAQRLHISVKTVATHRENVLNKLNISSIAELTRYAIREGLSSLDLACRSTTAQRNGTAGEFKIAAPGLPRAASALDPA